MSVLSGNGVSRRLVNSSPSIGTIENVGFSANVVPNNGASVKPPLRAPSGGVAPPFIWKLNVAAMLISFMALIALVNYLLGLAHLSLEQIFGWVFFLFEGVVLGDYAGNAFALCLFGFFVQKIKALLQ